MYSSPLFCPQCSVEADEPVKVDAMPAHLKKRLADALGEGEYIVYSCDKGHTFNPLLSRKDVQDWIEYSKNLRDRSRGHAVGRYA